MLAQGTHLSSGRDGLKRLDCMRDVAVGEPKEAATTAVVDGHDSCFEQNTEVLTCRGRGNAGLSCKFPRRDSAIAQQRGNDAAPPGSPNARAGTEISGSPFPR